MKDIKITFRVSQEEKDLIDKIATTRGITMSTLVREAIQDYLEKR